MIKLNADKSMLLLITKYWKHKDIPFLRDKNGRFMKYNRKDYIQACCNFRCFGSTWKHTADVYGIYSPLFKKLLSTREILYCYEQSTVTYRHTTFIEQLFSALCCAQVEDKIELDYSLVYSKHFKDGKYIKLI